MTDPALLAAVERLVRFYRMGESSDAVWPPRADSDCAITAAILGLQADQDRVLPALLPSGPRRQ